MWLYVAFEDFDYKLLIYVKFTVVFGAVFRF
ncbi:MAG: hypothetical protein FD155_3368 [Bacteroidetes bacterium]|nr:MAG: hypothetical protein FD155_3368 [Bacteroidota bacterium]